MGLNPASAIYQQCELGQVSVFVILYSYLQYQKNSNYPWEFCEDEIVKVYEVPTGLFSSLSLLSWKRIRAKEYSCGA